MHTQGLSLSVYLMAAILGAFFNIFRSLCMQHDDERNKFKKKLQQQQRSNETTKQVRWKANEKTKKKKKSSQQNMPYRRSLMAILNKDIVENQWDVWALRLRYIICLKNLFVFLLPMHFHAACLHSVRKMHIAYRNAFLKIRSRAVFFVCRALRALSKSPVRRTVREFSLAVRASIYAI